MSTYKITNITNSLGKRESKYNTTIEIDYIDNMTKKNVKVRAGDSVFLTAPTLPLSVQRLRLKNLVAVVEISLEELNEHISSTKPKAQKTNVQDNNAEKKVQQKQQHQQVRKKKIDKREEFLDTEKDV